MNLSKYAMLFLSIFACVPAKKYKELQSRYDAKDVELVEAKSTIISLQQQLEHAQEEKKALTRDLRKLTSSKANREKDEQISALESKIKNLEAKIAYLEKNQTANNKTNPKDNKTKKPKNAY